jgi:hypothetical protein
MSKHTPGPWAVMDDAMTVDGMIDICSDRPGETMALVACVNDAKPHQTWKGIERGCGGDPQANARLIAAAPDLLEACKSIRTDLEDEYDDTRSPGTRQTLEIQIDILSRAIDKAQGK